MSANWGRDLWDQYDRVSSHLDQGVDFVKRVREFVKDRAKVEAEYAKELRKLAKSYQKRKEDDTRYSHVDAFYRLVKEVDDVAGQHETVSENMVSNVSENLKKLQHDLVKEKRQHMHEGSKQTSIYHQGLANLEKARKKYEIATQDAEKAAQQFEKVSADMNQTRAQVEKSRLTCQQKSDQAEEAKGNYLVCLDQTNHLQRDHFFTKMPEVYTSFQRMEETRVDTLKQLMHQQLEVEMHVQPIIGKCRENIKAATDAVDSVKDSVTFVEDNRTGYHPPEDKQFEEYSSAAKLKTTKREPQKQNAAGPREDFSHLPPAKRKKKLQAKIKELEDLAKKETAEHTALEKMFQVYSANPSLGDKTVVQQQLGRIREKIDILNGELYKFETYLAQAEGRELPQKRGSQLAAPQQQHQQQQQAAGGSPRVQHTPVQPQPQQPQPQHPEIPVDDPDDFDKTCTVLYDFQKNNDGELSVSAGETLVVIEDDGSGWLHVRRGQDEGYIPLSYAEVNS